MAAKSLTLNPNYLAMVRGTCQLHQLLAAGKDDSPEADAIRDATDSPWQALSEVERDRVRNLSEDLYSLVEPPPAALPINPQAQAKLSEAIEAKQRGEWDRALDLLRQWRAYIDPALVSNLRGSIWLEAGDAATAALFFEHASKLQPAEILPSSFGGVSYSKGAPDMATVREWISRQWVLHDPAHKDPNSGGDLFRRPDGTGTDDIGNADLFPSEDEAKKAAAGAPENWQPRRLSDFLP